MSVVEIQYFHYDKWWQIIQSTNYVPVSFELRTIVCLQEHQQPGLMDDCEAMNIEGSKETKPGCSSNCQKLVSTQTVLNTTSIENTYQLKANSYLPYELVDVEYLPPGSSWVQYGSWNKTISSYMKNVTISS